MSSDAIEWEYDVSADAYDLYFTPFYEDSRERITTICNPYDDTWSYSNTSALGGDGYLYAENLEAAKKETLNIVEEHYQSEIEYYTELLRTFKEAREENAE